MQKGAQYMLSSHFRTANRYQQPSPSKFTETYLPGSWGQLLEFFVKHSFGLELRCVFAIHGDISLAFCKQNHDAIVRLDPVSSMTQGHCLVGYGRIDALGDEGRRGCKTRGLPQRGVEILQILQMTNLKWCFANDLIDFLLGL